MPALCHWHIPWSWRWLFLSVLSLWLHYIWNRCHFWEWLHSWLVLSQWPLGSHLGWWWQTLPLSLTVKCPAGNFEDTSSRTCIVCPLGTYQSEVGQTSCLPCPEGKTTPMPGSTQSSMCSVTTDVCVTKEHDCSGNAECSLYGDSYKCDCLPGYTGDGKNCTGTSFGRAHSVAFLTLSLPWSLTIMFLLSVYGRCLHKLLWEWRKVL